MFFKKKNKLNSKFQKNEFVSFHLDGDLKHGVINNIKELNGNIYYDIKVGGEATWLAKDISEDKVLKIEK
jgi:hypothetical protein